MIINRANLDIAFTAFNTAFKMGLKHAVGDWERVATEVSSLTSEEKYGWLGEIPGLREWVGPRVLNNLMQHDYAIKNKKFEDTVGVKVDDIADDLYGIYSMRFEAFGRAVAAFPNQLVYAQLKTGFDTACYDGQYYFDTDHPVLDANGNTISVANTDGGSGTPWFLIAQNAFLKPIIYQVRERPDNIVRKDRQEDDNTFFDDRFVYGVKARANTGFGMWQVAWGSKQTLNAANYKVARDGLLGMKGDYDRPLANDNPLLVYPQSLESNALEIINAERDAAGATNIYRGTATLFKAPWL